VVWSGGGEGIAWRGEEGGSEEQQSRAAAFGRSARAHLGGDDDRRAGARRIPPICGPAGAADCLLCRLAPRASILSSRWVVWVSCDTEDQIAAEQAPQLQRRGAGKEGILQLPGFDSVFKVIMTQVLQQRKHTYSGNRKLRATAAHCKESVAAAAAVAFRTQVCACCIDSEEAADVAP